MEFVVMFLPKNCLFPVIILFVGDVINEVTLYSFAKKAVYSFLFKADK